MEFEDLKARLEQDLDFPVEPHIWRDILLNERELLDRVRRDPERLEQLRRKYAIKEEVFRDVLVPKKAKSRTPEERIIPADRRLETLVLIAAMEARGAEHVRWFRGKVLGGRFLSAAEVGPWLREREPPSSSALLPLCAHIPIGDVHDLKGMGLLNYLSRGSVALNNAVAGMAELIEGAPEAKSPFAVTWDPEAYAGWLEDLARRVRTGEAEVTALAYPCERLSYRDATAGNRVSYVHVGEGGPVYFLKLVADWLVTWIPWTQEQAVQFVLTDVPQPLLRASMVAEVSRVPALGRLRLRVDPRMPAREIARFYEAGRRAFVRGRDKQMGEKSLALAVFCAERVRRDDTWKLLRGEWNEAMAAAGHMDWAYENEVDQLARGFGKDARDAYARVTGRRLEDARRLARHEEIQLPGMTLPVLEQDAQGLRRGVDEVGLAQLQTNISLGLISRQSEVSDEGTS